MTMEKRVKSILAEGPFTVDEIFEGLCRQTPGRVPTPSGINSLMWRMRKDNIVGLKYYLKEEHMPMNEPEEIETPRETDPGEQRHITMSSLHMATELARINPLIAENSEDFLRLADQIRIYITNNGLPEDSDRQSVEQRYIDQFKRKFPVSDEDLIFDDLPLKKEPLPPHNGDEGEDLVFNRTCDGEGRFCNLTRSKKHTDRCGDNIPGRAGGLQD